jgi:hypothetical protein
MRSLIHQYELHGLTPGLNWLSAQRPAAPEPNLWVRLVNYDL